MSASIQIQDGPATRKRPGPWYDLRRRPNMAKHTCSVEGCERKHLARGWCSTHYGQWWKSKRTCSIGGCEAPHLAQGWCSAHYWRFRKHGNPLASIPLLPRSMSADERFYAHVDRGGDEDCWLWKAYRNSDGYGVMRRGQRTEHAHRVAWEIASGPVPNGIHVLHHCDNPPCVNPAHLFLGTHQENMDDMYAKGRSYAREGEGNSRAVLSEADVLCIRNAHKNGSATTSDLARQYGVGLSTMSGVVRRITWKHI